MIEIHRHTRVLLISAVDSELACFDELKEELPLVHICRYPIGIGLLESTSILRILIYEKMPDWIVFSGSCGALDSIPIGTLILPETAWLYDDGLAENQAYFPASMPYKFGLKNPFTDYINKQQSNHFQFAYGTIASPPAITSHEKRAAHLSQMQIIGENLELASVAFLANKHNKLCAAVLGVSNHIGASAHSEWLANRLIAEKNACFFLKDFFQTIKFS